MIQMEKEIDFNVEVEPFFCFVFYNTDKRRRKTIIVRGEPDTMPKSLQTHWIYWCKSIINFKHIKFSNQIFIIYCSVQQGYTYYKKLNYLNLICTRLVKNLFEISSLGK